MVRFLADFQKKRLKALLKITEQLQKIYRQKLILDDLFDEIAVKKDE